MQKVEVKSWNILHIIHELNYEFDHSPVLEKYQINKNTSNESKRLNDIYNYILKELGDNIVMCLQEVPLELVNTFKSKLSSRYVVFDYKYSRIPSINKSGVSDPYTIKGECLVTIIPITLSTQLIGTEHIQFADPGKAAFILHLVGLKIFNVHLPFGKQRTISIEQIYKYINNSDTKKYVIIGDMNADNKELCIELKKQKVSDIVNSPNNPTRKYIKSNNTIGYKCIDHVISNVLITKVEVNANEDMSDHMLISCCVNY